MSFLKKPLMVIFILLATCTITSAQQKQPADTLQTAKIKVKGITCSNDLKTIAGNVTKLNGVNSCEPGKAGTVSSFVVKFNPLKVKEKEIYAAIEATGGCENPNDRPYKVKL